MNKEMVLLDITNILKKEFENFSPETKPSDEFKEIIYDINNKNNEDYVDILTGIFSFLNNERNIIYLKYIINKCSSYLLKWIFYLIEELNTTLDILFELGDIKSAFQLLNLMAHKADSRTLTIIVKNIGVYKDNDILVKLMKYRSTIESKVKKCLEKIEDLEVEHIITHYNKWEE